MEFALDAQQAMLQDSLCRTLSKTCTLPQVRAAIDEGSAALDLGLWRTLAGLGLPGLQVSEAHGGLGLTLLDAALAAEELGRRVAPVPYLATAVLVPLALCEAGSAAQQGHWLPRLASGECIAGAALAESTAGARAGAGVHAARGRLNGRALFAIDAAAAQLILVADTSGGLNLVDATTAGLTRSPLPQIDATRPLCELHFDRVSAQPLPHANAHTLTRLRDAGWVMLAADALGAAEAMLQQAVAYAAERRQFGRVIGSFQAVKHLCAEMAAELEPARSLVWYAAHAFDALPEEASLAAAHAKAHLGEIGRFIARSSTEVHGGIGITDLLGLHLWFKRLAFDRQVLGGPEQVRRVAGRLQGWTA